MLRLWHWEVKPSRAECIYFSELRSKRPEFTVIWQLEFTGCITLPTNLQYGQDTVGTTNFCPTQLSRGAGII